MKALKECKKYRELAMDLVDGLIKPSDRILLEKHIESCADCKKAVINMKKITKFMSEIPVEPPAFLETRIMAHIIKGKQEKASWLTGLRPVLSYAASFGFILIASLLVISRSFNNNTVNVADLPPATSQSTAKEAPKAVKIVVSEPGIRQELRQPEKKKIQQANVPVEAAERSVAVRLPEPKSGSVTLATADTAKQAVNVPENAQKMAVLGVKETTTDNPLLDSEGMFVANNLVNPLKGEFATIVVKVTEPENVKIIIYDKNVRPVSRILDEYKSRGIYEARWAGRTDTGETVSEGVYFVYVQIGKRVIKKPVIINKR